MQLQHLQSQAAEQKKKNTRSPVDPSKSKFSLLSDNDKLRWINRASIKLRGKEISESEDTSSMLLMSKREIALELMDDPDFETTILEFNLFYLGFQNDKLILPDGTLIGEFNSKTKIAPAVWSAIEVSKNGNFLKLLELDQLPIATPLFDRPNFGEIEEGEEDTRSYEEKRADGFVAIRKYQKIMSIFLKGNDITKETYCKTKKENQPLANQIGDIGISFDFDSNIRFSNYFGLRYPFFCYSEIGRPPDDYIKTEREGNLRLMKLIDYLETLSPENYPIKRPSDLKPLDTELLGMEQSKRQLAESWFWQSLPNSSTNKNRKRGAYILKRYFCDDLTPIAIETPAEHGAGSHAEDPACASCHYKLDPVAGFFRNHGQSGTNYSEVDVRRNGDQPEDRVIRFDDGATINLAEYVAEWKSPSSDREWNVGYIRSLQDESLNDYGENPEAPTIENLFSLIKNAKEVRQCLTTRMFEFFVGPNVEIDSGYSKFLAETFNEKADENSTEALKETLSEIISSNSFEVTDPELGVCYDRAPRAEEKDQLPCQIAEVMNSNCVSCHSTTNKQGGLDLSSWSKVTGNEFGFSHTDEEGKMLSPLDSLELIQERLSSQDPELRMPLKAYISSGDREKLYMWIESQIEKKEGNL